jgi:hypothetical protein
MMTGQPNGQHNDTGTLSAAQEKPLRESLEDASVLLWYATREGKQVSKETIRDIMEAQSSLLPGTRNPQLEGRFWVALRELAAAVKPASVDSILATYSYPFSDPGKSGKRRLVDAAATKRKYSVAAIFVLVCLLVVQIYWFIGTTFRADLEAHRAELDRIAGNLREMTQDRDASKSLELEKQEPPLVSSGATPNDAAAEPPPELRDGRTFANLTRRGSRVIMMVQSESKMLDFWDFITDLVDVFADAEESSREPDRSGRPASPSPDTKEPSDASDRSSRPIDTWIRIWTTLPDEEKLIGIENALVDDQLRVEVSLLNSKSVLAILSQYVLPLLYGLLGSLAYILRTLSTEIQNVTFTRGSEIRYSLRWPLGMLGGVTVGLFFESADFSGLAVITPLGLAFLAGYGVELLFTGLDRIVRAFTSDDTARPKVA